MKKLKKIPVKKILLRILNVLKWAVVIAVAVLPAIFMNSIYGYFPAFIVIVLMILSYIQAVILRRALIVDNDMHDLHCERGSYVDLGLKIKNRSPLITAGASALFYISDLLGGRDTERLIPFAIDANDTVDFALGMDMNHVGVYRIGLGNIKVSDPLGLVTKEKKLSGSFACVVTPKVKEFVYRDLLDDNLMETDKSTPSIAVGGTDYSCVREYVQGDPMKQIHWKLSAHSLGYMTKLQEINQLEEYSIILDFTMFKGLDIETLMDINDTLVETALSLAEALQKRDGMPTLFYVNRSRSAATKTGISEEIYEDLIRDFAMVTEEPGTDFANAAQLLIEEGKRKNRASHVIVLTANPTEELQNELVNIKRQNRSASLFVVIPAEYTSRDIEALHVKLGSLNEAAIPHELISTKVNKEGGAA